MMTDQTPPHAATGRVPFLGLIVAIVLLLLFICTAVYLSSVFFGFVLAFIFSPLQFFLFRKLFYTPKYCAFYNRATFLRKHPLTYESDAFVSKSASHAGLFSCMCVTLTALIILFGLLTSGTVYVERSGRDLRNWFAEADSAYAHPADTAQPLVCADTDMLAHVFVFEQRNIDEMVEAFAQRIALQFEQDDGANMFTTALHDYLSVPENRQHLAEVIYQGARKFFPLMAGSMASASIQLISGFFMTIVFFFIFSSIIAKFGVKLRMKHNYDNMREDVTEKTLKTSWFPTLTPDEHYAVNQILGTVAQRAKDWLFCYIKISLLEVVPYILLFALIGVPYALVFGLLSSMMIFFPIVGPFIVIPLTLVFTFAMGGTPMQLLWIALTYVGMFGCFETLFLYKRIIGTKLGLSLLEILIAVLLGGYLFGFFGMLLATPAASVLKYLAPKIYDNVLYYYRRKESARS